MSKKKHVSKSYLLIYGITAIAGYIAGVVLLINNRSIFAILCTILIFLLALICTASCYSVYKHGSKAIPRLIIFPLPRLWKDK